MRSKINARTVFLCSTVFFFLLNIIGILLFKDHIGKSVNTLVASVLFVIQLIRGLLACAFKDDHLFTMSRRPGGRYSRYRRIGPEEMREFYIKATVYFALLPFFLPLAVFSSREVHTLWCLLLLIVPQLFVFCLDMRGCADLRKERQRIEAQRRREKEEQERREELGKWK